LGPVHRELRRLELIIKELKISQEHIEKETSQQLPAIKHMTHLYNNIINTSQETNDIDFKNKTIIVVDDGGASGSTIIATTWSVRKNMDPKRPIVALPISPRGTINILKNEDIDLIEVITSLQNGNLRSIEQYYQNFDQITDKQVIDIIQRNLE